MRIPSPGAVKSKVALGTRLEGIVNVAGTLVAHGFEAAAETLQYTLTPQLLEFDPLTPKNEG